MSTDDDAGYVHRPGDGAAGDASADGDAGADAAGESQAGTTPDGEGENLGRKGWILVAAVFVSVLLIPGLVYLFPATLADAGVPFLVAFLVFPFLPAVLLGVVAVWAMTGAGRGARED